ncbi:MAG: hypothetical protein K6B70_04815 [Clostridia bacterium]|nr:hypothetical protein [Clostridia bacterium]
MYKVTISDEGIITRCSDNVKIGTISNYYYSDFRKYPNMYKTRVIKLDSEEKVYLAFGGIVNGKFKETCHLRCAWGNSCLSYKKCDCQYNLKFTDVGFYIIEMTA